MPEVSIVVPTRNGAATLPALIDAITAQADQAARELIAQRYLLEEDLPRLQALCEKFRPVFDAGTVAE